MPLEWQTLRHLAKGCAALSKAQFKERYGAPFLLELNPEGGSLLAGAGETRVYDMAGAPPPLSPVLNCQIVYFDEGTAFVMGRGAECELHSGCDTVSDTHCRFDSFGSIWAIKDEASKNGTFLNGRRMGPSEQSPLKFGTKLMLGDAQFLFLASEDAYELVQELSREPRIRPRSMGKYTGDFTSLGDAEAVQKQYPGPFLVVQAPKGRDAAGANKVTDSNTIMLSQEELKKSVNKSVTDAVFDLSKHNLVRIGRATVTQIHLPLGAISNLHAALVREDDGSWIVQDLGAKNGTYLWGDRLEGSKKLESGTELTLGNIKSIFFYTEDLLTYALHRDTLV